MKIAHCVHGLGLGGAQKVVCSIVAELSAEHEFFVYSSSDGVLAADLAAAGATIRIVPRVLPKLDPIWAARLARQMRDDVVDIVHTHLFGDSLHGYLAARLVGRVPVIMTLHNVAGRFSRMQSKGYRWLIPRCDVVVGCSEQVTQSFRAAGFPASGRITTVHNGIPDPRSVPCAEPAATLADLGMAPDAVVLATAGRMTAEKGHRVLFDALELLPASERKRIGLLALGSGPLLDELRVEASARGFGDQVVFTGFRDDVPQLLALVDIVVFSSLHEGLPLALLEAMANGRCIVATRVGGIPSAIESEVSGLLVDADDAAQLAAALARAIRDSALRVELGRNARRRFEESFESASMTSAYRSLYRGLAGPGIADRNYSSHR
jgi:glycosyltransferase involved in cell wall biosynthesis